jgi:monofunctional biosynthetic peptidoglycan transglycosylase
MFKTCLTVLLSLLCAATHGDPENVQILTSFDTDKPDFEWYAVNDDVMGGQSRGSLEIAQSSLFFRGELNTDGGGFSSIRTAPKQLDIGTYAGVGFRARGDGRTYKFRLGTGASEVSYMAEFQTLKDQWQDFELSFSAFLPSWRGRTLNGPTLVPADINSIGFMISDKQDGPFKLEVRWIAASPKE